MTPAEKEITQLRQRLKNSVMSDLKQEELIDYFKPIYYVEFETLVPCELFPRVFRNAYYDKRFNKKEALKAFEDFADARRVVEKSMYSGREKVIAER